MASDNDKQGWFRLAIIVFLSFLSPVLMVRAVPLYRDNSIWDDSFHLSLAAFIYFCGMVLLLRSQTAFSRKCGQDYHLFKSGIFYLILAPLGLYISGCIDLGLGMGFLLIASLAGILSNQKKSETANLSESVDNSLAFNSLKSAAKTDAPLNMSSILSFDLTVCIALTGIIVTPVMCIFGGNLEIKLLSKNLSDNRTVGVQAFVLKIEESDLNLHGGACVRRRSIKVSRDSRRALGTH